MRRPRIGPRGLLILVAACAGLLAWGRWFVGPIHAPGYSEANFRAIRVGDDSSRVARLIGAPLGAGKLMPGMISSEDGSSSAYSLSVYAMPGRLGGCEYRGVAFDVSGRVCKLLAFFQP